MGFLQQFLSYNRICIQCHNDPDSDTLASAFGVYCYLKAHGVDAFLVYGGKKSIKKGGTKMLVNECAIHIENVHSISDFDLLLLVDCQYGQGNVETFPADNIAIIDHHMQVVEPKDSYLIKSDYQSCSAIVYELLCEEGYPVKENEALCIALLYGLYIDTSCFSDLFHEEDIAMKNALYKQQPLFERLTKASMSVAELLIASDALYNHYFDVERHFSIVEALTCEAAVLGIIGDFMIQVDEVYLSFAYTQTGIGYQISLRTCHQNLPANQIAAYICDGIGNGGGHEKKAGGVILAEKLRAKYGDKSIHDVINMLLCRYVDEHMK